jgi:hypothetical protein
MVKGRIYFKKFGGTFILGFEAILYEMYSVAT